MPYPGPYHGKPWEDRVVDNEGNVVTTSTTPEVAAAYDWWDTQLAAAWAVAEAAGITWEDTITSPVTMVLGRGYPVNAASAAVALTLPTPVPGRLVAVQLVSNHATRFATVAAGAGASILGGNRTLKYQGTVEVLQAVSSSLWVVRSTGIPAAALDATFATIAALAGKANTTHSHAITDVTSLRAELDSLAAATGDAPPVFAANQTAVQSIPSGLAAPFTAITFPTAGETLDSANAHGSTNPSRWTCTRAGIYVPVGLVTTVGSSNGRRATAISKNGVIIDATQVVAAPTSGGDTGVMSKPHPVACVVGDYLEVRHFQSAGMSLDTSPPQTSFSVEWLRGAP